MENLENLLFDGSPISGLSGTKFRNQDGDLKDSSMGDFSFGRSPLEEIQTNASTTKIKMFSDAVPEVDCVTPLPAVPTRLATEPVSSISKPADVPHLIEIILWVNPIKTLLYLVLGSCMLSLWAYAQSGRNPITITSGLAYFFLLDLFLNFMRSMVSTKWQDSSKWSQSSWTSGFKEAAGYCIQQSAALHDSYLSASKPNLTLKVAGLLWVTAVLGSRISGFEVACIAYAAAFTVPVTYQRYHAEIEGAAKGVFNHVVDQCTAMKITRPGIAALFTLPFVVVCCACEWSAVLMALFVYVMALRCLLQPAEVEAIRTAAEPYTQSVRKAGAQFTDMAGDFINSYTPTPTKTKAHMN